MTICNLLIGFISPIWAAVKFLFNQKSRLQLFAFYSHYCFYLVKINSFVFAKVEFLKITKYVINKFLYNQNFLAQISKLELSRMLSKEKNGKPFDIVHKLKFVVKNMSHSKNNHKLPDRIRIDTQATNRNEDEGNKKYRHAPT